MQEKLAPTQLEDTEVILAAPGEMVVPPVVSESTQAAINADLQSVGLNPNDFVVGNGRINQITGLQQFGFLSDIFKKVKKVVKKVAPVALPLLIPGVGTAVSAGLSSVGSALGIPSGIGSSILGGKGILDTAQGIRTGIGGLLSKKPGQSSIGLVEDFLKGKESDPVREGGFLDVPTPKAIKGIEDVIKGQQTSDSFGGLASLAALYGLATKKAAEKTEGGLTDIRASRRPDLVAQPVFQGFDVGIRPGMAKGGLSPELFELDFRKVGGPTIGIGTGTSDDIPAMLSDGEYVMTADANNGAGGFKISKTTDSITLIPNGKPDREKGAKNLGMLMDMFEDANKRMA
jgi:hypothetical protein